MATSASILDLLRADSVAIYASTRDLLSAASVAALDAARSAARRDRLRAPSTSREERLSEGEVPVVGVVGGVVWVDGHGNKIYSCTTRFA